ncbi:MAG: hypothetical protein AMXMBFR34_43110 [Myxococcaceae bacterium]
MTSRQRLSASVDRAVLAAAEDAVARGKAPTLSAWVTDALRLKLEHDRRLEALDELLASYEKRTGVITEAEIAAATRRARERAVSVRGAGGRGRSRRSA